jgi:hypothetical protein
MKESYNAERDTSENVKTSSTDSKENSKTTGDSQVQDGEGVERPEQQKKAYEKSDEQQEYLQEANNNTAVANENPKQNRKRLSS